MPRSDARPRLLILGGTREAAELAARAEDAGACQVITSLAGRTRKPSPPAGLVRSGGFGGAEGLARYLVDEAIALVVDATHPFAARISAHAALACARADIPRLMLVRPPWQRKGGERWIEVDDAAQAAARLPAHGSRAFLTVGRRDLGPFADLAETWFLVRLIEPPAQALALARYELITGRGPFAQEDEARLLARHRIEVLVSKASGGEATYGKIAAARAAGIPVVMIRRPPSPAGERVGSVEAAMAWLEAETGDSI